MPMRPAVRPRSGSRRPSQVPVLRRCSCESGGGECPACLGSRAVQQPLADSVGILRRCGPVACDCPPAEKAGYGQRSMASTTVMGDQPAAAPPYTSSDVSRIAAEAPTWQSKLRVGAADDPLEREADVIAEQVMGTPYAADALAGSRARAGSAGVGPRQLSATVGSRIRGADSVGQPLPGPTRAFFEPRFGRDLGGVQVHIGPDAAQLSAAMQARAFTYGMHVWLGSGVGLEPSRVLAHELAHVVQQARPAGLGSATSATDAQSGTGYDPMPCPSTRLPSTGVEQQEYSGPVSNDPVIQRKEEPPKKEEAGCNIKNAGAYIIFEIIRRFADPNDPRVIQRAHCLKEAFRMLDAYNAVEFARDIMMRRPGGIYSGYEALASPTRMAIAEILDNILKRKDAKTYLARLLVTESVRLTDIAPDLLPQIEIVSDNSRTVITLDMQVAAWPKVELLGGSECDKYTFGYTQFVTQRTYINEYYDIATGDYRVLDYHGPWTKPCQDVLHDGDIWTYQEQLDCSSDKAVKRFGKAHVLIFRDTPKRPVVFTPGDPEWILTGISWFEKFVTVFSVMLPDGTVHHVSWFDWQIDFCENDPQIKQPTGSAKEPIVDLTGQHVQVNGIRTGNPPSAVAGQIGKPSGKSCNTTGRARKADIFYISSPLVKCRPS